MTSFVKIIWIAAITITAVGLFWFAYLLKYKRNEIGPEGVFVLYFIFIPMIIFIIVSIVLLINGIIITKKRAVIILILITLSLFNSKTLFDAPYEKKRIEKENRIFREENIKVTFDNKYEYWIGIYSSNTFLYVQNITANDELNSSEFDIKIEIRMNEIKHKSYELPAGKLLIELDSTDEEHIYILTTTPYLKEEIEVFAHELARIVKEFKK
jgi:hypothetical protein